MAVSSKAIICGIGLVAYRIKGEPAEKSSVRLIDAVAPLLDSFRRPVGRVAYSRQNEGARSCLVVRLLLAVEVDHAVSRAVRNEEERPC